MIQNLYAPFATRSITLAGSGSINYIDEGTGTTTLVMIHGLANYALGWKRNIVELRKYYRCIAIDLPGNGLSQSGDFPYGIKYFANVVATFIEELNLENVILVGHSMGGQIAITTVLEHPQIAGKLVLCAPAGFEVFTPWEASLYETSLSIFDYFSTDESSLMNAIYTSFYHQPQQANDMVDDLLKLQRSYPVSDYRKMVKACIHGMLHEPVFNSLHLLQLPVLVVFGERDALIPAKALHPTTTRKIAEEGTAQITDASLYLIPDCGHFVQWEKANEVNKLIREFVK
jgi:pimeloyl-ACP methyl ester carboxylesterase